MIDLHTTNTANGYKVSIMLEEIGASYRVIDYALPQLEHLKPEFLAVNPMGRIPTIVDHDGPDGRPLTVYGTAAVLTYLAEKTKRFLPSDLRDRTRVLEWLGIIASDVGPAYSGQFTFGVLAPERLPWAIEYYQKLCDRMLGVLEQQLARTTYLAGEEYTIADVIAYPTAVVSVKRYPGDLGGYPHLARWATLVGARPAVQRGMKVPR